MKETLISQTEEISSQAIKIKDLQNISNAQADEIISQGKQILQLEIDRDADPIIFELSNYITFAHRYILDEVNNTRLIERKELFSCWSEFIKSDSNKEQ